MMKTVIIDSNLTISDEERNRIRAEIEAAEKRPIVFDDDCPELSSEMITAYKATVSHRRKKHF